MIFLDAETPPIDRAKLAQRPVCVQTAVDDGPVDVSLWGRDYQDTLGGEIVGANIAYDMACLAAGDPNLWPAIFAAYDEGRVRDVLLDGKLLDIAAGEYEFRATRGWNLQELARRAGHRIDKDEDDETGDGSWRLRFAALAEVPVSRWPAGAVEYAVGDVEATRAVYRWQQARRAEWQAHGLDPLAPCHSAHAAASAFDLHLQSCRGILTDPATVERVAARLEKHLGRIGRRLQFAGLVRANGRRDTKKVHAYAERVAFRNGKVKTIAEVSLSDYPAGTVARNRRVVPQLNEPGIPAVDIADIERTPTLQPKVDRDQAILSGSRVLDLYADYSGASLLRGRLERLRQGYVLPLQTRFDPLKETGRTSSTQPQAPLVGEQMQNFPKSSGVTPAERKAERKGQYFEGLRECFRPRDGFVFSIVDLPSAEMHSFAQLCRNLMGWSEMGRLLNEGKDLHIHFAMSSLGRAYDAYDKTTDKFHRDRAKPANYGFLGGMGPDKFILYSRKSYGVRFTRDEAVACREAWRATFPDAVEYLNWIGRCLGNNERFTVVNPVTGFIRGGCYYSSGANNGFQNPTAYGAKAGSYAVTRACFTPGSPLWGSRSWNFVHDETVLEVPVDCAAEASAEHARLMTEAFNRYHPDYPLTCEPVLATRWSKHAEACYHNGVLIPWEPT